MNVFLLSSFFCRSHMHSLVLQYGSLIISDIQIMKIISMNYILPMIFLFNKSLHKIFSALLRIYSFKQFKYIYLELNLITKLFFILGKPMQYRHCSEADQINPIAQLYCKIDCCFSFNITCLML